MTSSKIFNNVTKNIQKMGDKFIEKEGLLHNRILLYATFVLSLLNLVFFIVDKDFTSITFFILIGFLTSFFSKNMMVVLLLSLILTNILKYGSTLNKEGMDEDEDLEDDENVEGMDEDEDLEDDENVEGMEEDEDLEDDENVEGMVEDEDLEDDENVEGMVEGANFFKKIGSSIKKTVNKVADSKTGKTILGGLAAGGVATAGVSDANLDERVSILEKEKRKRERAQAKLRKRLLKEQKKANNTQNYLNRLKKKTINLIKDENALLINIDKMNSKITTLTDTNKKQILNAPNYI